jgi:hypothetical protein
MGILQTLGIGGRSRSTALPVGNDVKNTLPDITSLDSIQKALQGDVASTLSGGEKLAALGALLKSASRGSQVSPQAVMASVQQTAQNRAATQLQLAQLQAAMNERAKFTGAAQEYAKTITDENKRKAFLALPMDEQVKRMADFTKDATPFQTKEINGKTFMVMSDKSVQELTGLPENVEGEWKQFDYNGDGIAEEVWINKRTGQPILNAEQKVLAYSPGMTPAQKDASARGWIGVRLDQARFKRGDGSGEGKSPDGKVRTVVYERGAPGSPPVFAQGQVLPGGFVRVTNGPDAGKIMKQARGGSFFGGPSMGNAPD